MSSLTRLLIKIICIRVLLRILKSQPRAINRLKRQMNNLHKEVKPQRSVTNKLYLFKINNQLRVILKRLFKIPNHQ